MENYRLKLRDFIPLEGIFKYHGRNNLSFENALKGIEDERTELRDLTLRLYNIAIFINLPFAIKGLVELISE